MQTLILSEQLRDITVLFDKYRSLRYSQENRVQRRREIRQARNRLPAVQKTVPSVEEQETNQEASGSLHAGSQVGNMSAVEQESRALFDELNDLSRGVKDTEKMMHEIAALNQMFSAQVLSQAEQIEFVYASAVEASMNIDHGNKQLRKTIKMNTSTRKYVLAILLLASFGLLFFHWFYS